jgi:hypothetical protein
VLHSPSPRNSTTVRSQKLLRLTRAALQTAFVVSEELGSNLAERLFTSPHRHPRPERERQVLATGRPFEVDVVLRAPRWRGAHTRVAAWRWGLGPTALLVHGWEGRGSQLGGFVEPLVAAGMSVVAFDAPAHGDSPGSRLYLADLADTIDDVTAAIGPLHATISHSFGSAAVLVAHARAGIAASRHVMLAPNVLIDDAVHRFAKLVALDDAERAGLEGALAAHNGIAMEALRLERLVGTPDSDLLVFHDREDREVAFRHGERIAGQWPGARLVAPDGLGHRRILRDDAMIREAVAFASHGVRPPVSDLVREIDVMLASLGKL